MPEGGAPVSAEQARAAFKAREASPLIEACGGVLPVGVGGDERGEGEGNHAPFGAVGDGMQGSEGEDSALRMVAAHYGNPGTEERALASGRAWADFSDSEVLAVSGADRLSWLDSLTSQRLEDMPVGTARELLVLSPQGHVENAALACDDGVHTWLACAAGYGGALAEFLDSMRFMKDVSVRAYPEMAVIGCYVPAGEKQSPWPRACEAAGVKAVATWRDPWPGISEGGATYWPGNRGDSALGSESGAPAHPAERWQLALVALKRADAVAVAEASGLRPAGCLAAEAVRVARWRPAMGSEGAAERALPHELDWLRTAVHLNKGCYRGQETVAKVVNLGKPPRRLVYLLLEGDFGDVPRRGAPVYWGEREVGHVTSAVRSVDEGPVALALVRRNAPVDAVLRVGDYEAAQRPIVSADGRSSASPATRPGAELNSSLFARKAQK